MNIIITGANSGIGFETSKALTRVEGPHKIMAISRDKEKLSILEKEFSLLKTDSKIGIYSFDLERNNYEELVIFARDFFDFNTGNHIDIIINNAGYLINKPLLNTNTEDIQKSVNINVNSIIKMTNSFFAYFSKQSITHIVNIGSISGVQGSEKFAGLSAYSISKAGVNTLTESMAVELNEFKIHTNCINPGAVNTKMLKKAFPNFNSEVSAEEFGNYLANFAIKNGRIMNGRLISVSLRN